jgi:hypothetical protein
MHTRQVEEQLEAPVLSGHYAGQRFFVLSPSAQAQPDDVSVSHAHISAAVLDELSHVRGYITAGLGDSGGGAFAVDTGALIGMVVGSDAQTRKAILLPTAAISGVITSKFQSKESVFLAASLDWHSAISCGGGEGEGTLERQGSGGG